MYLHLKPALDKGVSVADLFVAAFESADAVGALFPGADSADSVLRQWQRVRSAGPIFLDLHGADTSISAEDVAKIVCTIRDHWHGHGFCIARCSNPRLWGRAAYEHNQPLLCWRSLSIIHGWDLLGLQLRATDLDVFRHLVQYGETSAEQVARDGSIYSQRPNFADWRVQRDIEMERYHPGPSAFSRSEAQRILHRMHQIRIVIKREGFYQIVRPSRENGV